MAFRLGDVVAFAGKVWYNGGTARFVSCVLLTFPAPKRCETHEGFGCATRHVRLKIIRGLEEWKDGKLVRQNRQRG